MATCESNGHVYGFSQVCIFCGDPDPDPVTEPVDAVDQLLMMLAWQEDYTDEFKRKCLIEAIEFATQKEPQK